MSTNSTFNLNFRLKFLKFRKWSLDKLRDYKSPEYPLEKPQDGGKKKKRARPRRRPPRSLLAWRQIPVVSKIAVRTICFQKAEGVGGGGQGSGGEGSPLPISVLGGAFNSTQGRLSTWRELGPRQRLKSAMALQRSSKNV